MTHNIFHSLFPYRPREDRSSKENFLTEAFAHTLRANPDVCRAWLATLTGEPLDALRGPLEVDTQVTLNAPDGKSWSILDMVIRCDLADGGELTILSEHKWDSKADCGQLDRYLLIAGTKAKARVVFIAPTVMQTAEVKQHTGAVTALLWQDVHDFLHKAGAEGVREFVSFLALQGLGPQEPLSWPKLAAYVASRSVEKDCLRLATQLKDRDWTFLPARFQTSSAIEKLRWGRIGVELNTKWNPGLFLGFLLDGEDHQLTLVSPRTSIDLMLAFDADPKMTLDTQVLAEHAEALRAPGVEILHGPQLKNKWRKLVVREALTETLRGKVTEAEQVDAIYGRLKRWCELLFAGGRLEKALSKMSR
jgi:hypothetical protein